MPEHDYFLGTADAEIVRLGMQHRIWRPTMLDGWDRAGIGPGWRVVDVGSGPGFATMDLASRIGPSGEVLAVERSERFRSFLIEQARRYGFDNVRTADADLGIDAIDADGFDGVWCRWVACFVGSPDHLVRSVAKALRPGGVAVFHEYVDYAAWRVLPRVASFESFVANVIASWRQAGGEPDIARELPRLLRDRGFSLRAVRPLQFASRPGDAIWEWPAGFVRSGSDRLRQLGLLSQEGVARILEDFEDAERDPATVMLTPTVLEIIADYATSP
jgi:SAM-dependent methyltransferase